MLLVQEHAPDSVIWLNLQDFYKIIQKKNVALKVSKDQILQSMSDRRHMIALFVLHAHRLFSTVPTYVLTSV